ncbi:hypothetical protein GVO57_04805 [Sphingomonas changnyeongensis]|uniref:Uncharacterized protein n=1 Tax=Sphingomonas changnyeongensis TaxID=2698679 RepID=A0A7Z2S842_9SPHN|nr:hypothetical protein [Sphingomonas changnyeongensis]QHL90282.1 hypothetical protein GVO57_04805 [Sphingomonas changnyeongensis]
MTDPLDRMLDALRVPEPDPGFEARIAARAVAGAQDRPGWRRGGQAGRRRWLARHRTLASFIGANLVAAGAVAAALVSGVEIAKLPLIAPAIEAVAPERTASPPRNPRRPVRQAADAGAAPVDPAAVPVAPAAATMTGPEAAIARIRELEAAGVTIPLRVQERVRLYEDRKAARDLRAQNLPVPIDLQTRIVRARLNLAPPPVRDRMVERIERRRAAGLPVPAALDAAVPLRGPGLIPADRTVQPAPVRVEGGASRSALPARPPAIRPAVERSAGDPGLVVPAMPDGGTDGAGPAVSVPGQPATPAAGSPPGPGTAATGGQWRARLQQLPPAQRRQLIERWRARQAATGRPH